MEKCTNPENTGFSKVVRSYEEYGTTIIEYSTTSTHVIFYYNKNYIRLIYDSIVVYSGSYDNSFMEANLIDFRNCIFNLNCELENMELMLEDWYQRFNEWKNYFEKQSIRSYKINHVRQFCCIGFLILYLTVFGVITYFIWTGFLNLIHSIIGRF